jgi:hypothetical protein
MGKLGLNSGYIGSDQRTTRNGVVGYDKYYLERINGRFFPVLKADLDAQAFFTRVAAAGGILSENEEFAVTQLVIQMKADGIWDKMKAIYPMVGASAASCAQNLKSSSFTATFNGGVTLSSNGFVGNGTSGYMNTNLNPSLILTLNSTHQSLYIRNTGNLGFDDFSAITSATSGIRVIIKDGSTSRFITDHYSESNRIDLLTGVPDSRGFFVITRENSTLLKAKRNDVVLGTNTVLNTGTLPNRPMTLSCLNSTSGFINFASREYAFASLGDGLTDQNETDFYNAVQAFQTTLSRQV